MTVEVHIYLVYLVDVQLLRTSTEYLILDIG